MRPLVADPFHFAVFLALHLWAFIPEGRIIRRAQRAVRGSAPKDPSLRSIMLLTSAAWALAWIFAYRMPRLGFGAPRETLFWVGAAVLVGGSLLRRLCWRTLGEFFTGNVSVQERQPVVDRGPYRLVRHPSYTAAMLMLLGGGLMLGNLASLAALLVLPLIAYAHRMRVEERALAGTLGAPYVEYMRRTTRLVPWIV